MDSEDKLLIQRTLEGDKPAFNEILKKYEVKIYGLCLKMLGGRQEAYDMSQEVFIKAYENLAKFRGESLFSTWLYRIAINICLKEVNKKSKLKEVSIEDYDAEINPLSNPVFEGTSRKELEIEVRKAMYLLPPKQKLATILRLYEGLNFDEIGKMLRISQNSAKVNFFYGIRNLRRALKGLLD